MPPLPFNLSSLAMHTVLLYARAGLDRDPPMFASYIAGMTGPCYHTQLLLVQMGSYELFAQGGLDPRSSGSLPPE
jgi:hypothetical protein